MRLTSESETDIIESSIAGFESELPERLGMTAEQIAEAQQDLIRRGKLERVGDRWVAGPKAPSGAKGLPTPDEVARLARAIRRQNFIDGFSNPLDSIARL